MSLSSKSIVPNAPLAVELFAGVGGFSLGMKAAGINVALAIDSDEQTLATYSQNFPETSVVCADVQELKGLEIRRLLELSHRQQGLEWDGKIGLVFGGPPCQGLSRIGKRDVDDPRNQLIAHFCRLVEELQPAAFVLENVPDLLLPKYAGLIEPSLQQLQQAGYNTWTWVLNAKDYGVPQNRKRVFIGGILHHTSPRLPAAASQVVTVKDAIGDLTFLSQEAFPQLFDTDELQLEEKQSSLVAQPSEYVLKLEQVFPPPPATNPHLLTGCCFTRHTASVVQRFEATAPGTTEPESRLYRLKWDGVARTLRAGTGSDKGRHTAARPIHPTNARVLTVREAARLSSFPDWFRFHRRIWRGMRQVGNAVPPLLALAVGEAIYRCLTQLEGATAMETATLTPAIASGTVPEAITDISPTQKLTPGEHQLDPRLLKPHPRNASLYGEDESVSDLVELIRNSNWLKPLVITPDLIIISGHRRWKAALELGWLTIPVIVREFKDALAELEVLLLENACREKTIEQKVREAALWKEIEQESAKQRQGTRRDIQENFPGSCEQFGQSRERVAQRVGLGSGKTYQKAVKVVYEIDKAVSSGCLARANALRSVLNHQSVDGAFKLTEKPVAESDPILELIASGEARTPKQAQLLLKNRQRLKEQSLLFTPAHEHDESNSLSDHLTKQPGGLVEIYAPELSDWHQRHARIESVGEKQCKVWKRNIQTTEMELRSFPHADLTPLPLSEVPSLLEINSRIQALYQIGGLDPFDRYILQSLERCVNLTPTELEYLNQIELKYQQGQQSNPSVPDATPLHEHSIPVSSPHECRIETFDFPLPPTLNEMIRTARGGWQASAKEKREWTELIASSCKGAYQFKGKIWLEYVWQVKNLARDNNNIAAATKYIDDGLVEAGVIADDSLKYIQSPVCHWYVQSSEDMVTVRIANAPIYNGELLTTIGGSSEFLSAVSTQVQLSKALRNVSPATLSAPSQTVENPQGRFRPEQARQLVIEAADVQKWNDDPKAGALCPRKDDYNIFFATMRKSGKDNSGEKIWRRVYVSSTDSSEDEEGLLNPPSPVERRVGMEGDFLQDIHGHLVVDHDLYNHEGLTEDGIAEAFIEFAKKEGLSFFKSSPSVTPFDTEKYQRLMDGLEAVELSLSEALKENISFRVDSDFFKKQYLHEYYQREKFKNVILGDIAFITDGQHGYHEVDETSNISHITAKNTKNWFTDKIGADGLAQWVDDKNKRSSLKENDVLLANRGTVGCCSIVKNDILPANIDQDIARIALNPESPIFPEYLLTYLNSKIGYDWVIRNSSGMVQQGLPLNKVSIIPIPISNNNFQIIIKSLIELSCNTRQASKQLYQQSENLLLLELNLKDWQPTEETIAVKSFTESYLVSDRLDAEYYQPKQQKVMAIMRQSGFHIGDIAKLAKRKFQPEKQGTFNYIEIGNLSGEGFANSEVVAMEEAPSRAQWIVKTNDVITSTVRPIRRLSALIEPEQNNYICSSGFAVLKPVKVESEVLLVYLRLPVVCEILNLHTTASMYPAISIDDLLNIPITLPDESIRQKIAEKVRASRKAREQSKQLLEIAKTGVERAIETDEATATTWMNQQLEALGVELSG